jgi:urease accessory protein
MAAAPSETANLLRRPEGIFDLSFFRQGERTRLGRQFVSYPFHITRPFLLDKAIPELLTLYQQSSSGGLYRADKLRSRFQVGPRAAVHLTTQSATIVHNCHSQAVQQDIEIKVEEGGFFAYAADPLVLFPGASLRGKLQICAGEQAVVFTSETISYHDPQALSRPIGQLAIESEIRDGAGTLLCRDRLQVSGKDFLATFSPDGDWRVLSSYFFVGPRSCLPGRGAIEACGAKDAIVGVMRLPHEAGWGVRCAARTTRATKKVSDQLFELAVLCTLGSRPELRRK